MPTQFHFDRNTHKGRSLDDASLGVFASALFVQSGVVVDGETVTIGAEVYEFDAVPVSVGAGNISVDVSGGLDAVNALAQLTLAVNANGKSGVSLIDLLDGSRALIRSLKTTDSDLATLVPLAETGVLSAIDAAVNNGKKAVPPRAFSRSPTALEVIEGLMFWAFDRASTEVVVTVTDVTGLQKAWNGLKVLGANDILTLDNSGTVDWDADDTVTVEVY